MNIKFDERFSNSESNEDDDINELMLSDINKCKEAIEDLFIKYNKNKFIQNKIINYITITLPNNINLLIANNNKKIIEKERKQNNINEFIGKFLNNYKYFYNNSSDIYFYYDDKNYNTIKEDTIISNINNYINKKNKSINNENNFETSKIHEIYDMKEKIKSIILKKIKDTTISTYIPESCTIQNIFNILIPTFFSDKYMTKYFLTCIGDIILKKNNSIFIINNKAKSFIKLLSSYSYNFFGTSYFSEFKYKYHEQQKNCKIIKINNIKQDMITSHLHQNILNILSIAIHYSYRFNNSESYITNECDTNISNYINILNNNKIIDNFIENNLEFTQSNDNIITSKNMHYLWKDYLNNNELPKIYFSNNFKLLLKEKIIYNDKDDIYLGIISKNLPIISKFLNFWETNFTIIENYETYNDFSINYNNQYEISEILNLYKKFLTNTIKEEKLILILQHYYENILIKDNNILNINCKLWNKENDIIEFLLFFKTKLLLNREEYPQSLVTLYSEYINYGKKFICIVNKTYFIEFIKIKYANYIDDNIILSSWWNEK